MQKSEKTVEPVLRSCVANGQRTNPNSLDIFPSTSVQKHATELVKWRREIQVQHLK